MNTPQILSALLIIGTALAITVSVYRFRLRNRYAKMAEQDRDKRFFLLPHHKAKIDVTVIKDGAPYIASITVLKPGYVFDTPTRAPFATIYPDK
jgi:hypothetical protein